jgi:hypothetical protein
MSRSDEVDRFVMTRADVSRRLRLSPERIRQLAKTGDLPARVTRLGRLYDADAVEAYAQAREIRSAKAQP